MLSAEDAPAPFKQPPVKATRAPRKKRSDSGATRSAAKRKPVVQPPTKAKPAAKKAETTSALPNFNPTGRPAQPAAQTEAESVATNDEKIRQQLLGALAEQGVEPLRLALPPLRHVVSGG